MYSAVLETKTRVVGHDSLEVAKTYCNMANVYESQGLFERALEFHQKDLNITVNILGHDSPLVADTLQNIGVVHQNQGRATDAREVFSKAYHIRLDKLGPNHPHTTMLKRFA